MTHYWFISKADRKRANLALFTFVLAFVVILLGAYTRLTHAGLSCPDWPNCYGYITAPHTDSQLHAAAARFPQTPIDVKKAWTEMTHRYFAGTEGILILALAFSLFRHKKSAHALSSITATTLLVLLGIQVMLGMLNVKQNLKPVIVLSHLVTGLSILSVLWWTYLNLSQQGKSPAPIAQSKKAVWIWIGLIIVAAQIILGGWVSTHYAGLACIDFPYCNGQILPDMQWRLLNSHLITIHMLHRIGAAITAVYLSALALFLWRLPAFKPNAKLILALVALQLTLGVLNIIWLLPVWLALFHHAVAVLLLLTIIATLSKIYYAQDTRHVTRAA